MVYERGSWSCLMRGRGWAEGVERRVARRCEVVDGLEVSQHPSCHRQKPGFSITA